eukprot:scaffold2539_cov388-Prasinococcus_capsulatus_cf.AAC.7
MMCGGSQPAAAGWRTSGLAGTERRGVDNSGGPAGPVVPPAPRRRPPRGRRGVGAGTDPREIICRCLVRRWSEGALGQPSSCERGHGSSGSWMFLPVSPMRGCSAAGASLRCPGQRPLVGLRGQG